jgi:hypothetical protein
MSWDKELDQIAQRADSFAIEETEKMMKYWRNLERKELLKVLITEYRELMKTNFIRMVYLRHPFRWAFFCIKQKMKYCKMKIKHRIYPHQEYER